jgi:hypothetical protein
MRVRSRGKWDEKIGRMCCSVGRSVDLNDVGRLFDATPNTISFATASWKIISC